MDGSQHRSDESFWLWFAKLASGGLVIFFILVHLVANHLVVKDGLMTYADVAHYFATPGIALMETCFLTIVVSHSLLGLRSIILDLNPSRAFMRILNGLFILVGSGSIVYGIWLTRLIVLRGS